MKHHTSLVKKVGAGIDTLYINVSYSRPDECERKQVARLDPDLAFTLEDLKEMAKEQEKEVETPWWFRDKPLMMHSYGTGKGQWSWLMTSPLLDITISQGQLNGVIAQVRLSSQLLWSREWCGDVLSELHQFLVSIFGDRIYLQVSEVHLCADIMGWRPRVSDWQRRFISRAVSDKSAPDEWAEGADEAQRRWKEINYVRFGQPTGRMHVVIYDKTGEIERASKKTWFHDLWRENGWDGEARVWRIEARYKRPFLHSAHIEGAYDFLNKIKDLWAYAVGNVEGGEGGLPDGWLRLAIPGEDKNRSRWPVDPVWQVVQTAFDDVCESHLGALVFQREKERNIQRLVQQMSGCVASLAAQGCELYPELKGRDLDATMAWLTQELEAHYQYKKISFKRLVAEKQLKLASLNS